MTSSTLIILGATGDLSSRLLLPALGQLLDDEPDRSLRLVGAGIDDVDTAAWRARVGEAFGPSASAHALAVAAEADYVRIDITDADDLRTLFARTSGRRILYFAVAPAIAQAACEALTPDDIPAETILALEKPFGSDEEGARSLNATLAALVPEHQIFRIDHFLGRSMVLNLLGVRFANRALEPVWHAEHVESVVIRYDESLGLEGRAGYYDKAGALADMIQSHLLQVLALVAMEPPATLHEADFRANTTAVLRATHVQGDDPARASRRARYVAGTAGGERMPAYADQPGVDPARQTETLAEVTFEVRTERWAGVPFTLRSGKALGRPTREIVLTFRPVRHLPDGFSGSTAPSVLRFSLGPDAMSLELNVNGGDSPFALERATMSTDLGTGALRAYTEVIGNILDGDAVLAVRGDAAEHCWRIVQPVIDAWRRDAVPLDEYPAGTSGPEAWPALP
ncbi:glucose-6-phosphate dehydrogenase [Microbacterium chocolatum]|uniref:glucose-6-phosphate dehydrogenase n=1 Tax=Microbacterium aurantiacum TaxID=162393 RepID=UPI00338E6E4A